MVNNIPFINDPKYDDGWVANDPNYDNQSLMVNIPFINIPLISPLWLIYHGIIIIVMVNYHYYSYNNHSILTHYYSYG
jgi:hypothetical protein